MFGSVRIGTIRGIPIKIHFTLIATFALLAVSFGWMGVPAGILLFGSVLLHELGHSVVAQYYGIPISSITLHLMGGMALMARPPRSARQEILIAAAGPLVSLLLALLLGGLVYLTGGADLSLTHPSLLAYGAGVNFCMFLFNLIPALPMDGGRIFRAALVSRFGLLKATRVAATVTRVFAALFIIAGLKFGWSFLLIGALLLVMVAHEERVAEAQEASRRETREVFVDHFGRRYVVVTRLVEP